MYCVFLSARDFQQNKLLLQSLERENRTQELRLSHACVLCSFVFVHFEPCTVGFNSLSVGEGIRTELICCYFNIVQLMK